MLAPQPCYIDRGTPIAVDMTLATLSEAGYEVDLLTFPGGEDRHYPGLRTFRVTDRFSKTPARPGLSAYKLLLDILMLGKAIKLAAKNRYTLVHAVEESSFIALVLRVLFRIPYLSDMDSRMTTQITDRFHWLKPFDKLLWAIESLPIRFARGVVTMCDSLRDQVSSVRQNNIFVVKDVSLLDYYSSPELQLPPQLAEIRARHETLLMYIGNLESYQGIDLLLEAFSHPRSDNSDSDTPDLLVSPRIQGTNTPLKIYSYLDSGVPVICTNLQTHTQVVDSTQAKLCAATPAAMAGAITELINDPEQRARLAQNAKQLVNEQHSVAVFRRQMLDVYCQLTDSPSGTSTQSETSKSAVPAQAPPHDNQRLSQTNGGAQSAS